MLFFAGCYVIRADVTKELITATELVLTDKSLSLVEQAFRDLKTVSLETQPTYHKTDDRIRSHLFICMMAYHLQWHLTQRLRPLFESDGQGKNWQSTIQNVLETLQGIRQERAKFNAMVVEITTQPGPDQPRIPDLLKTTP